MRQKGWVEEYDFLVIPQPQPDELLSSWLTRTAFAHGYSLTTFISLFLKHDGSALSRTDIDFKEDPILFEKLANKSRFSIEQIAKMSLRSEEGYLFESDHGLYPPKQIRILKDKRTHYGLMFCPKCLAEDTHPYWRKQWRYHFYNACTKHNVFLIDRCGICQERVRITKMKVSETLTLCNKCGRDLRLTSTHSIPDSLAYGIEAIKWFEEGLTNGYFSISGVRIRSLFIFQIHTILSAILDKGAQLHLEAFPMIDQYKGLCKKEEVYHSKKATPIYKNFYLNAMVYYLLQNLPDHLKQFTADNHLTHRDFIHGFQNKPFWYQRMIDELVPMQNKLGREISESEVIGAINYLKSVGEKVTQESVASVVGCHFTIHKGFVHIYHRLIAQRPEINIM
jgi:hypothetical protein